MSSGEFAEIGSSQGIAGHFVEHTLPLFLASGWDHARGGLIERLSPAGVDDGTPFRRSMVHGRQLYVYSTWAHRLQNASYEEHADRIYAHLVAHFYDRRQGGWYEKLDLDNALLSGRKLLYGTAFVLFGLVAYRHLRGNTDADRYIDDTFDFVLRTFRTSSGDYLQIVDADGQSASAYRSQNPLMHFLEAVLYHAALSGSRDRLFLADELVTLACERMIKDGVLLEHLTASFDPDPESGHIFEPGHQMEWGWLLNWYSEMTGTDEMRAQGHRLMTTGMTMGWDRTVGGLFDEVDRRNGRVVRPTKRLWSITEAIKAATVAPGVFQSLGQSADGLVDFFLRAYARPNGAWSERLNADLTPVDASMPSSSCYHMSVAVTEYLDRRDAG